MFRAGRPTLPGEDTKAAWMGWDGSILKGKHGKVDFSEWLAPKASRPALPGGCGGKECGQEGLEYSGGPRGGGAFSRQRGTPVGHPALPGA